MYNSIYPVNINYRKYNQNQKAGEGQQPSNAHVSSENNQQSNTFPNGTKVAIDYNKGQINISQVLTDFRSTIVAINAPEDVKEEVGLYLGLVEKESLKENPSRDIILGNLKNASKISDAYIASSLKKPSNVVEGWIDALFLQKINLKADPNEINPDFLLEFPKKAQDRIDKAREEQKLVPQDTLVSETAPEVIEPEIIETPSEIQFSYQYYIQESYDVESELELSQEEQTPQVSFADVPKQQLNPLFSALCKEDEIARNLFIKAKKMPQTNIGDTDALNLLNEALGVIDGSDMSNKNIRAAIHFERGKIFDSYDYVDYALRDYWEATKADDLNLKAQAFYKSAQVYDEFSEFSPALDNYLSTVAYCGEADNMSAQSRALTKIASLYTKQFDINNVQQFSELAISTANNTQDESLIAQTYSQTAQNYQYLGDNDKAIDGYKNALEVFSRSDESYEQMAYNYEQAALVMKKLGNHAKAAKLQLKANQCYQKALQQQAQLEEVS